MSSLWILDPRAADIAAALAEQAPELICHTATHPTAAPGDSDTADTPACWLAQPDLAATALHARLAAGLPLPAWVQSTWAGLAPLVPIAHEHPGLHISGVRGIFGEQMAAWAFGHLLAHSQRHAQFAAAQRRRSWQPLEPLPLRGRRCTVFGTGAIGAHLARAALPFGLQPVGVSRSGAAVEPFTRVVRTDAACAAVRDAAVVMACLPDTPATAGLLDAAVFDAMPTDSLFLNLGRGASVDHSALCDALRCGSIAGAVLDVFPQEPLPADDPLWDTPGLTITPHVAALTRPTDIARVWLANRARWQAGQPLAAALDPARGY